MSTNENGGFHEASLLRMIQTVDHFMDDPILKNVGTQQEWKRPTFRIECDDEEKKTGKKFHFFCANWNVVDVVAAFVVLMLYFKKLVEQPKVYEIL